MEALHIEATTLELLGLTSFKEVTTGDITILQNRELCYIKSTMFVPIKTVHEQSITLAGQPSDAECRK